jgi:hypothetical protein
MKEYETFDIFLKKSKLIREFCDEREKMMFEVLRMNISVEGKIHWLESVGVEIDRVLSFIERLSNERKLHLNMKK